MAIKKFKESEDDEIVRKTTLREVVEMYIKESKDLGDGKNHRSKFISQNTGFKPLKITDATSDIQVNGGIITSPSP